MGFIAKFFGKKTVDTFKIPDTPFRAQIIFECDLVPENNKKVQAAVEEFTEKYPDNIAEPPRVNIASDGNVIEIVLICKKKEELMALNKELELIARRYGLR
jgi:hypothetical protein